MAAPNAALKNKLNEYTSSNDFGILKEVFEITKSDEDIKSLLKSNIISSFDNNLNKMPRDTQVSCLKFFNEVESKEGIKCEYTETLIREVMCLLTLKDKEVKPRIVSFLSSIIRNKRDALKFVDMDMFMNVLSHDFNRKTHKSIVEQDIKAMGVLFSAKDKNALYEGMKSGLLYCLNHVDYTLVLGAVNAIHELITDDCDMISKLISSNVIDQMYAQFGVPDNSVKAAQFKIFSTMASCCQKHAHYVSQHKINERIPAFICHFDDECCMNCLKLLQQLHVSVKDALDAKYVVTLVLHVAMSSENFKIKSYEILKEYIENANPSEINQLVDEGFIRPFCTLMVSSDNNRAREICSLLLNLVENFNILDVRIARFDFDHAHNSSNASCVNQISEMLEREDPVLRTTATQLLEYLKLRDIVIHPENE